MTLFSAVFGRKVVKNVQKIYMNIFRIPEHVWVTSKQPLLLLTTAKTQKSRFWGSKLQTSKWTTLANWERVVVCCFHGRPCCFQFFLDITSQRQTLQVFCMQLTCFVMLVSFVCSERESRTKKVGVYPDLEATTVCTKER